MRLAVLTILGGIPLCACRELTPALHCAGTMDRGLKGPGSVKTDSCQSQTSGRA
jgi:hypothetical protein